MTRAASPFRELPVEDPGMHDELVALQGEYPSFWRRWRSEGSDDA
ncbi:MAG: hypothetical protein WA786_08495 [Acidimicrobiales bacterium]